MYNHLRYRITIATFGLAYWLRSLFVDPAPISERCYMGGPVHPWVQCPRYAIKDGLWCIRHDE